MKIVRAIPPNFEAVCKAFPEVRNEPRVIFTYGDTIYAPGGEHGVTEDLAVHEEVHQRQQENYGLIFKKKLGPWLWWNRYLKDSKFRLDQELRAYRKQYRFLKSCISNRDHLHGQLLRLADDLSAPIYGGLVTKIQAIELIKQDS